MPCLVNTKSGHSTITHCNKCSSANEVRHRRTNEQLKGIKKKGQRLVIKTFRNAEDDWDLLITQKRLLMNAQGKQWKYS